MSLVLGVMPKFLGIKSVVLCCQQRYKTGETPKENCFTEERFRMNKTILKTRVVIITMIMATIRQIREAAVEVSEITNSFPKVIITIIVLGLFSQL